MRTTWRATVGVMLVLLLSAGPIRAMAAGPYDTDLGKLSCPLTASRGQKITVNGSLFTPRSLIMLTFDTATPLGSATADKSGKFSAKVQVPSSATVGLHKISAKGPTADGGTVTGRCVLLVLLRGQVSSLDLALIRAEHADSALKPGSSSLPFVVGLAMGSLLVGCLVVARRRRHAGE